MDILENVTVIIPAHNRPERLQRLLDYYRGTGLRVIVPTRQTLCLPGVWIRNRWSISTVRVCISCLR